jgi:multicomponent Na+:H+ antiporter subunit D
VWLKLSGLYPPELRSINLDSDVIYRRWLPAVASVVARLGTGLRDRTVSLAGRALRGTWSGVYRHHGPEGVLARSWATGSSVIWVCILLLLCLIVYYR